MALLFTNPMDKAEKERVEVFPAGAVLSSKMSEELTTWWFDAEPCTDIRQRMLTESRLALLVAIYQRWYEDPKFDTDAAGETPGSLSTPPELYDALFPYIGWAFKWEPKQSLLQRVGKIALEAFAGIAPPM